MKIKTNKFGASPFRLKIFSGLILSVVLAACGYNHSGTFGGKAEYEIYKLEPYFKKTVSVEDMTFTIAKNTAQNRRSDYILKFGEKSPLQCTLEVSNQFYDREGKGDETADMTVIGAPDQTCKVLDADGNMKTAHVSNRITGKLLSDETRKLLGNFEYDSNLQIELFDGQSYHFKLDFKGKRN